MIQVVFFAQVRELIGESSLQMTECYPTVDALRQALCLRGERWTLALDSENLLCAVNHTLVSTDHVLVAGDEVAFFPPVTGG